MLTRITSLYRKLLGKHIVYFQDGTFFSRSGATHQAPRNQLIVVSAKHTVESHQFFSVSGKRALRNAVNLYAQQLEANASEVFGYAVTGQSESGYFVTISVLDAETVASLQTQAGGGNIVIPEVIALINSRVSVNEVATEGYWRRYITDPNYGLRVVKKRTSRIASLMANETTTAKATAPLELSTTAALLTTIAEKFPLTSVWLTSVRAVSADNQRSLLSPLNIGVASGVLVLYLLLTSGYLWWQQQASEEAFQQSRERIVEVAALERQAQNLRDKVSALNEPLMSYQYLSLTFAALAELKSEPKVERLTADSNGVTMSGTTANATQLFKELSDHPNIEAVEFMTPVRKKLSEDMFNIEFEVTRQ